MIYSNTLIECQQERVSLFFFTIQEIEERIDQHLKALNLVYIESMNEGYFIDRINTQFYWGDCTKNLDTFYIVNKIGKFTYNDQRLVSKTNNCPTVRSKLLKKEVEPSNSSSNNGTGANVLCLLLT